MTALRNRKTRLMFTTDATVRYRGQHRPLVVEVPQGNGFTATIRLQGTRTRYDFSWLGVFDKAVHQFAELKRREKKEARKLRKGLR